LKVVNVDNEENLGPNQQGELRVKSPSLMTGYYKSDSSGQFDKDGFLKTQDLGYYDEDRCIYVVGRMREMFRYFGWQIIPSVIEAALLEFPAVKEAVVFAVPLETEEKGAIPGALVVLAEGFSVKTEEIQDFVAQHVAEREQLKGGVMIVKEIPKTPTGKAIRKEAQEYFLASLKK
jgi:4-coumarate--CoA ligase